MTKLPPLFNISRILPLLQEGRLILTPNNRLRSKILQAWGDYQQANNVSVWPTPRIVVIEQWFTQQWQLLQAHGYPDSAQAILSSEQQRVLWESITADCGLMQTDAVAKQAANAYATLIRWNQPVTASRIDQTINPQFIQWIQTFQQRVEQLQCITPEESMSIIGNAFAQKQLKQEPSIHLLGFDDIAPLLQTQLDKASPDVRFLSSPTDSPQHLQRVEYENSDSEMQAAAQWSRSIIEQSTREQTPVRIGIIVPNLGKCRQQVERAFSSEFEAHSFDPNTERYTLPFNFSAGTPLGDTPLITAALQLLKLQEQQGREQEWDVEFLSHCLLSPFWGRYTVELESRSALVSKLQSLGIFTISGDTLRYWAEKIDSQYRDTQAQDNTSTNNTDETHTQHGLFNYLHAFHQLSTSPINKGKHLPSRWVEIFLQQLDILQWPGERTPDSQEYQQTQQWYQLLETFASLDSVLNAIDSSTALQQLQSMANHMPFQAKVPDSPIQILGILEGAGLHFSHCWIMGLHQKVWPPAPTPNSLLPIQLQREHNMPHASSLRELAYAQSLTDNYRHCADTIIFSSPTHENDDEQTLLASQLISDIPLSSISTQAASDSLDHWYQQLQNTSSLDTIDCATAPEFIGDTLPGGSGLFKSQAENPFDSFIKYRLHAPLPIDAVNGFSHIEKGNILHNSLAAIWTQLKHQDNLLALSNDELAQLINEQVTTAISDIKRHKPKHLSDTLCKIESERQSQLINQWLTKEKQRPPFSVVAIEQAQTIQFNGMNISIRIDRVDQLQDGRYLIIDYKTGTANINAWKGERPREPQLPLYALTYGQDIKGISFAQINIKDQCFNGAAESNICEGINELEKNRADLPRTWNEALAQWQHTLSQLLKEFQQGHCAIQYNDDASKNYAREYLRINRFYEADAIENLLNNNR